VERNPATLEYLKLKACSPAMYSCVLRLILGGKESCYTRIPETETMQ